MAVRGRRCIRGSASEPNENQAILPSMAKTDAECASPQSSLGITRTRAGVLQSPYGYTKEDSHHHRILRRHRRDR